LCPNASICNNICSVNCPKSPLCPSNCCINCPNASICSNSCFTKLNKPLCKDP
jgi:hypothetical protein